jgi:hypothetical protein
MRVGDLSEIGTADHFLHFKDIDPEALFSRQAEKQQFQAILTRKLGTLVNSIKDSGHLSHLLANNTMIPGWRHTGTFLYIGKTPENSWHIPCSLHIEISKFG